MLARRFGLIWSLLPLGLIGVVGLELAVPGVAQAQFGRGARARGGGASAVPPAGVPSVRPEDQPSSDGPGRHALRIAAAGWEWDCLVHVPRSYRAGQAVPVVLILHGSGGDGKRYLEGAGWAAKAEIEGFLAVAPDGLPANPGFKADLLRNPRIWNSGQHDTGKPRSQIDDLAFFRMLLDHVAKRWSIDAQRVYVTGHSNGGAMAFRLAAQLTERFAAAAPVAAHFWIPDPRPARPIPTLFLVGDADPLVPFQGGLSPLPWNPARRVPPLKQTLDAWAFTNGLEPAQRRVITLPDSTVWMYGAGVEGVVFKAVLIKNQGHGWPGGTGFKIERALGPNRGTVNATDAIWTFFAQHRNPRVAAAR